MTRRSAILGYVVLIVLLSAGAAQSLAGNNTVTGGDIVNGSVSSADIRDGSVSYADVKDGAVGSKKILDNSVQGSDVRNDTLTGADINESSLSIPKVYKAQVNQNGSLRSSGSSFGVSSEKMRRTSDGLTDDVYLVTFPADVSGCVATASAASFSADDVQDPTFVLSTSVTPTTRTYSLGATSYIQDQTPSGVVVVAWDATSAIQDLRRTDFALSVVC